MSWFSGTRQDERLFLVGEVLRPAVVQGVDVGHVVCSGCRERSVGNGAQNIRRGLKVKVR